MSVWIKTALSPSSANCILYQQAYFSGNEYVVFDLLGWKCGMLICYDNNVIENVRATTLLGAEILFAPHVTMCTPSPMPGRGFCGP
jgi:predicted amidohydrolase